MKTKLLIVICVLTGLMLTACGKADIVTGYKSGDVKLGQYKGVTYTPEEVSVTDDEIMSEVQSSLIENHEQNVDVEGKTVVENGDTIICDYKGFMDGEQFEGGTVENSEIIVGSEGMIPGFMEGFVGAEIGVEKEFDVTFPDPYQPNTAYSGKPATFKILVHRIVTKALPDYNDELVKQYTEYTSVAEYEDSIRQKLTDRKQTSADSKKKYDVFLKIIRSSEFDEDAVAPLIVTEREKLLTQSDSLYSQYFGIDAFTYYNQYLGMKEDEVNEYFDSLAKMQVEYNMVLAAVADKEDIQLSDAEIDEFAEKMRESNGFETLDELNTYLSTNYQQPARDVVASQCRNSKALDLILTSALAN